MDEPIQVSCRFLDLFSHLIVAVEVEDICHQLECILIVLHLGVEAGQIESIGKIVFVNLAEVFVATRRYELCQEN